MKFQLTAMDKNFKALKVTEIDAIDITHAFIEFDKLVKFLINENGKVLPRGTESIGIGPSNKAPPVT